MQYCDQQSFNTLLKLFAPYIPHITEELNSILYSKNHQMINKINMWPKLDDFYFSSINVNTGIDVLNLLELVRKYKSINELSLRSELREIHFSGANISKLALLDLKNASNCKEIYYKDSIVKHSLQSNCGKYSIKVFL